ncbi:MULTISPECIES: PorV/PorQ family protein [unclassified Saccharicrinis]|uniref:PorV/PorQ family protein n=1 Tax=unclassified Saccharicrinis TaxID=2646859 RepID=UPI003D3400B8
MIRKISIISALILLPLKCFSQAGSFSTIPLDAKTTAKGNTFIAGESNASIYSNLAAANFGDKKFEVDFNYRPWQNEASLDYLLYGFSGFYSINNNNGVAIGFKKYNMPNYNITDENGNYKGTYEPSEFSLGLGYVINVSQKSAISVSFNYLESNLGVDYSSNTFYLDLGFKSSYKKIDYGLMIRNLGPKLEFDQESSILPLNIGGGITYPIELSPKHLLSTSLDLSYLTNHEHSGLYSGIGLQYQYNNLLALRSGYGHFDDAIGVNGFTFGGGVHFRGISVDVAWLKSDSILKNNFNISCSFAFNKK